MRSIFHSVHSLNLHNSSAPGSTATNPLRCIRLASHHRHENSLPVTASYLSIFHHSAEYHKSFLECTDTGLWPMTDKSVIDHRIISSNTNYVFIRNNSPTTAQLLLCQYQLRCSINTSIVSECCKYELRFFRTMEYRLFIWRTDIVKQHFPSF